LVFEPWRAYLGSTLPDLSDVERQGGGPFVFLIPSLFMSLRILGFDGDTALVWHSVFAVAVVALLAILLRRNPGARFQSSLVLIATCLVTPYLHVYDLGILLAGALPVLRTVGRDDGPHHLFVIVAVSLAWILPQAVEPFGLMRLPLSPLVVGFVFAVASFSYGSDVARVGSRAAGAAQAKRR
jgi:hypothetical protein